MPSLWDFTEVDQEDAGRAARLRGSPPWAELIRKVCHALRAALLGSNVMFSFEESCQDDQHLRAIIQFPLGCQLFDWLFNGREGYRAQFRTGHQNGLVQNAVLISEFRAELTRHTRAEIIARRLSCDFKDKGPMAGSIGQIVSSLDPHLSKVWVCDNLIGNDRELHDLFVSRTGPKLTFSDSDPWVSLYSEDGAGWLDVKGAFVGPNGVYQRKSPEERAANLEVHGSA